MHITKFLLKNYRAITSEVSVSLEKQSLIPIIGVNECGKTTILNAIFAFDFNNDSLNDKGKHLQDTKNLYKTQAAAPLISAEIEIDQDEIDNFIKETNKEFEKNILEKREATQQPAGASENHENQIFKPKKKKIEELPRRIIVSRNLTTKTYNLRDFSFGNDQYDHLFCTKIINYLPYILYFDDFRDSIEEKVEIIKDENGDYYGWLEIVETLFKKTAKNFSVFNLKDLEVRERKSVLAQVKNNLNKTLTNEWKNFKLEEKDSLTISIDYVEENDSENRQREYLKFEIIETDIDGNERYFFIRDRSKGFYWFFNFVMKLEFNPKENPNSKYNTIYLLDEPGSYLHASAQEKLCKKLVSLSEFNKVIYCTHSHYLLNPEVIPLGSIRIADKNQDKSIGLRSYFDYEKNSSNLRLAFQPLYDALQFRPFPLDVSHDLIVLVEGITDFFVFEMFNKNKKRAFMPCVGANSIKHFISILLAWKKKFYVFWDNDEEGRRVFQECEEFFGNEFSKRYFFLYSLPLKNSNKVELEQLFYGTDIKMLKERLNLDPNTALKKVIAQLYYSREKNKIIAELSDITIGNIQHNLNKLE
ncbi:hypothetical protein EHQ13_16330 [Leptospira gomenensis]|uniref:Uncharacterized protein n=1 Tax=Leptospira gomenensis TaxID=2484974 RepID=A0A5F1YIN8_9LEPT|nr:MULTISPECIES: AAA family ATPase [Leptospira]TGK38472.1 hypothetical protein EHQ17_02215 [Leptospira gomenensis]TGK42587.1 hypothetical protein EHQ07_14310 [Leptospira gomenensis]TGK55835.1 hypothetical protein EHQ13_16330 [Leptospira gomenensis]TGM58554.1 hypothetical protein EHQ97_05505 [Leptospira adleri]